MFFGYKKDYVVVRIWPYKPAYFDTQNNKFLQMARAALSPVGLKRPLP